MPIEFKLPELGENVEKGDVVRVLVAPGDVVKIDQPVLELETDKATIEVPSSVSGKVTEVRVKPGEKVKVGQIVLVFDGAAAVAPVASAPVPSAAPRPAAVAKPAAVVDISAGRAGSVPRGDQPAADAGGIDLASSVPAAPSVRRFARELGVDISGVPGTGPGGRVGQDDVKQHVKGVVSGAGGAASPLPDFSKWGDVEVRPMSNIRRKTAEHLSAAWQAPHVTLQDKADVTALEDFRRTYGPRVERAGGKLTMTAMLVKIAAAAIQRDPRFASSPDLANEAIIYKKYCHIAVAVDTPNGLLVPVIRDADRKTITEISVELAALSQRAREKKLTLDDMSGSVFSISNLGGIGLTGFTPIVNRPEVAILGVSRSATEPVWLPSTRSARSGSTVSQVEPSAVSRVEPSAALGAGDGQFVPRQMLPLSLSFDHRVIDGADGARFLRLIVEGLEQPMTLVL